SFCSSAYSISRFHRELSSMGLVFVGGLLSRAAGVFNTGGCDPSPNRGNSTTLSAVTAPSIPEPALRPTVTSRFRNVRRQDGCPRKTAISAYGRVDLLSTDVQQSWRGAFFRYVHAHSFV